MENEPTSLADLALIRFGDVSAGELSGRAPIIGPSSWKGREGEEIKRHHGNTTTALISLCYCFVPTSSNMAAPLVNPTFDEIEEQDGTQLSFVARLVETAHVHVNQY